MNEAISSLAEKETKETNVTEAPVASEQTESVVESAKSEVEKVAEAVKAEAEKLEAEAVAEAKKIEADALHVVTELKDKVRNVFQETEAFVKKEEKKVWNLVHGGGSVIKNPA